MFYKSFYLKTVKRIGQLFLAFLGVYHHVGNKLRKKPLLVFKNQVNCFSTQLGIITEKCHMRTSQAESMTFYSATTSLGEKCEDFSK